MATATITKRGYPYVSVPAWQVLRKKFHDSPPKSAVTADYLKNLLKFETEDAGKTLASSLKRVGLIDDEGKLAPRAYRWRDDAQYKAVCDEILEEVYPQTLRDLFGSPGAAQEDVQNWFLNDTHKGKAAAYKYARFYLMLLDGDFSKLETDSSSKTPKAPKAGRAGASTNARQTKAGKEDTASQMRDAATETTAVPEPNHDSRPYQASAGARAAGTIAPSIHLDFQIHIAADSPPALIDGIFESMAKHLRTLMSEAGE